MDPIPAIDVRLLPARAIDIPARFPRLPVVYFVLDSAYVVHYIGQTRELRKRYGGAAGFPAMFTSIPGGRIAWHVEEDRARRLAIEKCLIRQWLPRLNRVDKPHTKPIHYVSLPLPLELSQAIDRLAYESETTITKYLMALITEAVAARKI